MWTPNGRQNAELGSMDSTWIPQFLCPRARGCQPLSENRRRGRKESFPSVFDDGEMRGQDAYGFQAYIEGRIAMRVSLGTMVMSGQWLQLDALAKSTEGPDPMFQREDASDLITERDNKGEQAARGLSQISSNPDKLWGQPCESLRLLPYSRC